MLKFQIQEPNKLSNPEIQNQQNPTFKFKKSHPHFQTPNQKKKKKKWTEKPITQIQNWKIKENLEMNIPLSLMYSGANGQRGQQASPSNWKFISGPKSIKKKNTKN